MNKKLLRKKLALMLANLKKKRKYFCECEYLQSSGTQYIDLGITSKSTMRAKAKFNLANVSAQAVFGSATVSATGVGVFFGTASTGVVYCNRTDTPISPSLTLVANTNYEFDMSLTTVSINGVNYTASTTTDNNYNMLLFARILAGSVDRRISGKIYYFKLYDNGVLIRDMIPVLGWDGKGYMYDKVSDTLFGNAGTGSFTYGREIHYVEYLENTTRQATLNYIPTTYTPTTNTNLEAKVRYTGGASGATWAIGAARWWGIHYQGQGPKIGITNSSTDPYQVYTPYTAGNDITLKLDGSNVYADGTLVGSLTKQNASSTLTVFRYATSANLSWVGRIYYLDIWDNNGDVFKFRPAIDENDTFFMFDKITHTAYNNAGSGSFIGPTVAKDGNGKIIENEYE